jgi:hypothetical protein
MTVHPKRPRDPNQLAKSIIDIATGQTAEPAETGLTKRARAGGTKGGPARANSLTPEQRSQIARETPQFGPNLVPNHLERGVTKRDHAI